MPTNSPPDWLVASANACREIFPEDMKFIIVAVSTTGPGMDTLSNLCREHYTSAVIELAMQSAMTDAKGFISEIQTEEGHKSGEVAG